MHDWFKSYAMCQSLPSSGVPSVGFAFATNGATTYSLFKRRLQLPTRNERPDCGGVTEVEPGRQHTEEAPEQAGQAGQQAGEQAPGGDEETAQQGHSQQGTHCGDLHPPGLPAPVQLDSLLLLPAVSPVSSASCFSCCSCSKGRLLIQLLSAGSWRTDRQI